MTEILMMTLTPQLIKIAKKESITSLSGKPLPNNSNYPRNQSRYNPNYRGRSPEQRNSRNFSQNRYSRSNSQIKITTIETAINDQIQTKENFLITFPIHILGLDTIQTIDYVIHHTIEKETQITETEVIQITETNVTKTLDQETTPTTDLIIKETITITIIGQETTHKIGIPTITIEEIVLNPLIETTIVTLIPKTIIEVTQQNISDKLIRFKQLKKQLQIPLVLTTQKVPNYS